MFHGQPPRKAAFHFLPEGNPMMDASTISNTAITVGGVAALLPIGAVVWGAARISGSIDRIAEEFREFKQTVERKLETHDLTINLHTNKIAVLETRAETTHERLERYEKKP